MRPLVFNIFTLVCLNLSLLGQQLSLIINNSEESDTLYVAETQIDSILIARLATLKDMGYWDATIELSVFPEFQERIQADIFPGSPSIVSHIHFSGLTPRGSDYLEKEFKMGQPSITADKLQKARRRLNGLGYQLAEFSQLSKDRNAEYHLKYEVSYRPELKVQGLASFNKSSTVDTVAWYGQFNVSIPNFDGKGKSLNFSWKRLTSNTESFNLGFNYPWLFQWPLVATFQFGREVIDGNYQVLQTVIGLGWDVDWERSIFINFEKNQSIITHEGSQLYPEWVASEKRMIGLGYRQTRLNARAHNGISLKTTLYQELNFEPQSIKILNMRSEAEYRLSGNFHISQRSQATIQNHTQSKTDPSILMPLGGVNSVRGYEEAYLRSPNTLSVQNAIHLSLGRQSQILAFYDIGLHNTNNSIENIQGYGLGVQLRSGRGPIRLILASHKGIKLGNSFFHLEYSGGIPWIDR
jgi:outer membrane protein assembly factor BamA